MERELQQWQREPEQQDEQSLGSSRADIVGSTGPSVEEVFLAYFDCRKNKRNSGSALAFEQNLERHLMQLHRELNDGTYRIGRSTCFVVSYPKWREVWAANFRDRIVHHLIYNRIADRFHRRFIYDSYACIPGRGTLFGVDRVHRFMRQATENWQRPAHYLQADMANFFVSIDKRILAELALPQITPGWLQNLAAQVIFHDPTADPVYSSPRWKFSRVPRHKSLFNSGGRGLPIGNLSSQFFANVYMDALDQFVKRKLGVRWYGRYVDDVVLIGHDPHELNAAFVAMERFVQDRLGAEFHPRKTTRNLVHTGINFCGYILKPHRTYLRRRTARALQHLAEHRPERGHGRWTSRMNSYLGLCQHANTYSLRKQVAIASGAAFGPRLTKIVTRRNAR